MIVLALVDLAQVVVLEAEAVVGCHLCVHISLLPSELEHFLVLLNTFFMVFEHPANEAELLVHEELLLVLLMVFADFLGLPIVFEGLGELAEFHEDVAPHPVGKVFQLELNGTVWVILLRIQHAFVRQVIEELNDVLV